MNPNKALWEKGDFTRIAATMRESGEALVNNLGITNGLKVLDLGCGDGTTALPAAALGADVLGVDIATNLVEAGNRRAREHARCREHLERLRTDPFPWAVTWAILYEFLRVSTHPRVFEHPLSSKQAWSCVDSLLVSPSLQVLVKGPRHREVARRTFAELPDLGGPRLLAHRLRQQPFDGFTGSDRRDDDRRSEFFSRDRAHADRGSVLDEDRADGRACAGAAACGFDDRYAISVHCLIEPFNRQR